MAILTLAVLTMATLTTPLVQTTLASPPSAALEVTYQLQATLAAVPSLVAGGKRQVRATHLSYIGPNMAATAVMTYHGSYGCNDLPWQLWL